MVRRAIGYYNTLSKNRSAGDKAVYVEFGRRLQSRMIALGWSQTDLARFASAHLPQPAKGQVQGHSIGRDQISSYIRGKYLPRPHVLEAIAKALGCEASDLLPAASVPSVGDESPAFSLTDVDGTGKRVALRINRVVTRKTAAAIIHLLEEEDKL